MEAYQNSPDANLPGVGVQYSSKKATGTVRKAPIKHMLAVVDCCVTTPWHTLLVEQNNGLTEPLYGSRKRAEIGAHCLRHASPKSDATQNKNGRQVKA